MFKDLKSFAVLSPQGGVESQTQEPKAADPPSKFGASRIVLSPDGNNSTITILEQVTAENHINYSIFISNYISYRGSYYAELVTLLKTLTSASKVIIYIGSPGGSLDVGAMVASAIKTCKAEVTTVAIGSVASAASLIWSVGHKRIALPGSALMFHMSSHGDWGNSVAIKKRAENLVRYVKEVAIDPLVVDGLLTVDEAEMLIDQRQDVWLDSTTITARLEARHVEAA